MKSCRDPVPKLLGGLVLGASLDVGCWCLDLRSLLWMLDVDDWMFLGKLCHRLSDQFKQIFVTFHRFKLRKLLLHVFGRAEKETHVGFTQHRGIIESVACGEDVIIQQFEGSDGALFLFGDTELIIDDTVFFHDQAMAQQRRPPELAQQRSGELLERVRKNDYLDER